MARRSGATSVRIALTLALAGYAALVVGSGLDRLTAQVPPLERLVPGPLRAEADRAAARQAAVRGDRTRLMAAAQAAVAHDPVDPGSTSLLGAARLLRGDNAGAEQAFRVAARFGWRDIPTQVYWLEAALEAGEMEPAADRLDAILRARPFLPAADALLEPFETTPAGRLALERRLAVRPYWLGIYVAVDGKPSPLIARRATVLAEMARRGNRLGCTTVDRFVTGALAAGARREAEQVWVAHCPGAHITTGIADPEFDRFGAAEPGPFGWQTVPSGDVTVEPVGAGPSRRVRLSTGAAVSRLVLVQPVALAPGHYRLGAHTTQGRLAASFGCSGQPPLPRRIEGDIGGSGQLLEAPACPRLSLGIWLRPGTGAVELDRVSLTPVR
jgi:hypothetical protein